jgi:hypothetical protein
MAPKVRLCASLLSSRRTAPGPRRLRKPPPGAAARSALAAAVRRLQLVPGHRCTQHPRALRATAAGNARHAPCTHNAARRRGAKVTLRRGTARHGARSHRAVLH